MNHFNKFKQLIAFNMFLAILLPGVCALIIYVAVIELTELSYFMAGLIAAIGYITGSLIAYFSLLRTALKPLEMVWQAIWHVSPDRTGVTPPNLDEIKIGRELVSSMVMQVYDLASSKPIPMGEQQAGQPAEAPVTDPNNLVESIPLSMFVLDKEWKIKDANNAACVYLNLPKEKVVGQSVYDVLNLSFKSDDTLDKWLKESAAKRATDTRSWEHVKLNLEDNTTKQLDLVASYSKDNSAGNEAVLLLFDRSGSYSVQDQATSYIAMAVHELRTPLTMLRGYIEMFEEELGPELSVEHQEFMRKMSAAAQNLAAFVSNILNVARIDENQFNLTLHEADWGKLLSEIVSDLELRASVRGKKILLNVDNNLPSVAIDKISVYEVVSNLVDNAIKYSGQDPDILIRSYVGKDGNVETVVEDHGVGIPQNVIGGLFTKYYRSHRSKNAVSGSGLGLYLVKSIVTAHGGNVWVQSKEGEGSQFGFTLIPYANLSSKDKAEDGGIERQANGWIKNHSLYRR